MEEGGQVLPLVADSNVLFRFLLLSPRVRRILYSGRVAIYAPDWAVREVEKYLSRIADKLERRGVGRAALRLVLAELFSRIIVVPREVFRSELREAYELARAFDPKDTPFIALARKLRVPIWTEDRDLIKRGLETERYLALDTRAVEELLAGSSLADVLEGLRRRLG